MSSDTTSSPDTTSFSDTRSSSDSAARRRAALFGPGLALVLCCGLWSAACGHRKPPKPPPSKLPQTATLTGHQRGSEVIVEFPFPTTTISGTPLPGISKIEIWRFGMEVPEFAIELLTEEDARREEAQDLLDELGLELYETPLGVTPEGDVADPYAIGTAPVGTLQDPATGLPAVSGMPGAAVTPPSTTDPAEPVAEDTTGPDVEPAPSDGPSDEPSDESSDGPSDEPSDESSDEPSDEIADEPSDETADEPAAESGVDAVDAGTGDDSPPDNGDGDGEDQTGEDAAGEDGAESDAPELTPEEELAIRIEAARNLLRSPPTPKSSFIAATAKDFAKGSELVLTVEADDIGGVVVGDLVVLRIPLPPRPEEGPEIGYLFGAKLFALNGKPSDLSNTVALLPEDVPAAPSDVKVEAQRDGVLVEWTADEEPEGGFRIYRRDAQSRNYGQPLAVLPGLYATYVDRQAIFGGRYIYGVTAVASTTPLLESDISSEHEVDYRDDFGPAVPGGLVAFPEAGRVRLLWTPVPDTDLAGYEIRRRASLEDDPAVLTDELVTRSQHLDEAVATGETWLYSVVAVDQLGNRSEPGAEVQVRVP